MLTIVLNLKGGQLSQFGQFNFNSMCKIGDKYVGANSSGIFELNTGSNDAGNPIEAFFELPTSDWGIDQQKRIRSIFIGLETDGKLSLTVRDDDENERIYTVQPNHDSNQQHSIKLNGGRDGKGRYWMIRIDNVNGSDFSIDSIKILPIILNLKPSGA